jgi:curved DNA-binding protein CbpA
VKDFYTILEVSRAASPEVIRAAYRSLAKRYHPDNKDTGNPAMFRACKEAHDVLCDVAKRALYDAQTMHTANGHTQHAAEPQGRPVWVNGRGWVIVDDMGPYPNDPIQPQYPQPYPGQGYEEMMRQAAGGIAHSLADRIVDEIMQGMMGRRRR